MIDPTDWWKVYATGWQTALKIGETLAASNSVIDSRMGTMRAAAVDPIGGDYAELGRMMPEKVDAFGLAAKAMMHDAGRLQSESIAHLRHMTSIMARGGMPTMADVGTMASRADRVTRGAMGTFGRALAPVHKTATANARRLRK